MSIALVNPSLSDEQKRVLFERDTEAPFTGKLVHNNKSGDYKCANCSSVLFGSETKFDSGSGWPSFYAVKSAKAVRLADDNNHDMQRVEARCNKCGAHLGHVFKDAPSQPTGTRFCINSCALDFKPKKER